MLAPDIAPHDLVDSLFPNDVIKSGWGLGLVGAGDRAVTGAELARMKPSAVLLNVSRVALVAEDALIAEGARVGPRAVVSAGCQLADGAEAVDSVLLDGCSVGENARVENSILAPGAMVEPGAHARKAHEGL